MVASAGRISSMWPLGIHASNTRSRAVEVASNAPIHDSSGAPDVHRPLRTEHQTPWVSGSFREDAVIVKRYQPLSLAVVDGSRP